MGCTSSSAKSKEDSQKDALEQTQLREMQNRVATDHQQEHQDLEASQKLSRRNSMKREDSAKYEMSLNHNSLAANLQGHLVVLRQEISEIDADIAALQGMHSRYAAQNGISFDGTLHNLGALRNEKINATNTIAAQLASLQDTISQTAMLATSLERPTYGSAHAAPQYYEVPQRNGGGACPVHSAHGSMLSSFHGGAPPASYSMAMQPPYGSTVQLAGPGGLVVTTNSSILAHSPRRTY